MTLTQVPDLQKDWQDFLAGFPAVDERGRTIDPDVRGRLAFSSWSSRLHARPDHCSAAIP
jgi:hypothetical protein